MRKPIGAFLAELRREKQWTQQKVAEELGISNRTLSSWEQGRAYPDILSLSALARLYGVTADEILAGERRCPPHSTGANGEQDGEAVRKGAPQGGASEGAPCGGEGGGATDAAYARLDFRCSILTGVGFSAILLLFFGFWLASEIVWAGIALAAAGVTAFIIVCFLLSSYTRSALLIVGAGSRGSGLSPAQRQFALQAGACNRRAAVWLGCGWLAVALAAFVVFSAGTGAGLSLGLLFLIPLLPGVFLLGGAVLSFGSDVKRYAVGEQRTLGLRNARLLRRCVLIAAVTAAIAAGAMAWLRSAWFGGERLLFEGNAEQFVRYMHTLVVTEQSDYGLSKVVPCGEYALDLSTERAENGLLNAGGGFYALTAEDEEGTAYALDLYYGSPSEDGCYLFTAGKLNRTDAEAFNVRFGCEAAVYSSDTVREYLYSSEDGVYRVSLSVQKNYGAAATAAGTAVILAAAAGAGALYAVRRKKWL